MDENNGSAEPPGRMVTVNQVVAWNIAWYRRAAKLSQRQLGERLGRSHAWVSEAERSWDGNRTREFDAQLLTELAGALGIQIAGLFLPPDDEEDGPLLFPGPGRRGDREMRDLTELAVTDSRDDTPAANAYRARYAAAADQHLDEEWAAEAKSGLRHAEGPGAREDDIRARLLAHIPGLMAAARDFRLIADAPGRDGKEDPR
jgi:transcriptional regulator with XRE-family HTH domain